MTKILHGTFHTIGSKQGAARGLALGTAVLAVWLVAGGGARAQAYKVTSTFGTGTGDNQVPGFPASGVVVDKNEGVYGVTGSVLYGGTAAGQFTTLKAFGSAPQGTFPDSDLAVSLNCAFKNLQCIFYGTTYEGGARNMGLVYKVARGGDYQPLYSFKGGNDGANPRGRLALGADGSVYGMTQNGGPKGYGLVFKIAPNGVKTNLLYFTGPNGADPGAGGLTIDGAGNLYGTTYNGGPAFSDGIAFKLAPDGTETALRIFSTRAPKVALNPDSGLVLDAKGNFYGSTYAGGTGSNGTAFKIGTDKSFYILHSFTGGSDGGRPTDDTVSLDAQGNVYGTTQVGGSTSCNCGVVYKITPGGQFFVLHTFAGSPVDGATPVGNLFLDGAGILHGVTDSGGIGSNNAGVLYEINLGSQAAVQPGAATGR